MVYRSIAAYIFPNLQNGRSSAILVPITSGWILRGWDILRLAGAAEKSVEVPVVFGVGWSWWYELAGPRPWLGFCFCRLNLETLAQKWRCHCWLFTRYIFIYMNITQFVGVNQCRRSMVFLSNGDSWEKYRQLSKKVPCSIDADPPTLVAWQLCTPHACYDYDGRS